MLMRIIEDDLTETLLYDSNLNELREMLTFFRGLGLDCNLVSDGDENWSREMYSLKTNKLREMNYRNEYEEFGKTEGGG